MSRDQVLGGLILLASLLVGVGYFYLIFFSEWVLLTIQLTAFVAVAAVLFILGWIGYTLATTPPPTPIEDLTEGLEGRAELGEEGGEDK